MKKQTTRPQPNLAIQINLFSENSQSHSTAFSAPHRGIQRDRLSQEDSHLVKWLSSRLDLPTLTPREESALVATKSDRHLVMSLLGIARERGLVDHLVGFGMMVGKAAAA